MNNLIMIKKSVGMMLAIVLLISIVGSAMAREDSVAPGRMYPLHPRKDKVPPTPPSWKPSWMSC